MVDAAPSSARAARPAGNEVGKRIVVIGNTGTGKSTLAAELARRLVVPFVELDALYWEPGWREPDSEVFRARVREATSGGAWVVAGNYLSKSQDLTWPRADTVVILECGLPRIVWRVTARAWRRWRKNELLWGTNRESIWKHARLWDRESSLIAFAIEQQRVKQREHDGAVSDPRWSHIRFIRLRSPRATARWLESVPAAAYPRSASIPSRGPR